eukprot:CAMPEP_0115191020 /NCGR_PEP_ID=MMETSP0270-20121206/12318_1 /TAXON_ID=71861 /ORGANISM="Scrippsiella trochoidea, Strain CCMP3099" /LENGTH=174 /DNA_ID=CAMNT_0002604235 /DNA_START=8 /DNA_END=535 /DNA_ORIENTATION=-
MGLGDGSHPVKEEATSPEENGWPGDSGARDRSVRTWPWLSGEAAASESQSATSGCGIKQTWGGQAFRHAPPNASGYAHPEAARRCKLSSAVARKASWFQTAGSAWPPVVSLLLRLTAECDHQASVLPNLPTTPDAEAVADLEGLPVHTYCALEAGAQCASAPYEKGAGDADHLC